jgi:Leu/Phe-tRNA-protein transferase
MPPLLIKHDGYPVDFGSYDLEYDHEEGLVAVGANFYPETLISAYTSGLFPWFIQDKCLIGFVQIPEWFSL